MTLTFLGPVHAGGGANVVVAGAAPYAGVVWRVVVGAGTLTPSNPRADAGGIASARYDASGDSEGAAVQVEADVYGS